MKKTEKAKRFAPLLPALFFIGCTTTVDLENTTPAFSETAAETAESEEELNEAEMHELMVQEEMKVQDIEKTVVYVEKPVYVPAEEKKAERVQGSAAAREFLPERVYDDGSKTYITVNKSVLQKELPLLFNEKNEIVNYTVNKNVFVVPRLINKVTLRLGKEKVVIEKKKTEKAEITDAASESGE